MFRKLLALLAALTMLLGMTSCGDEPSLTDFDNAYAFYLKDGELMMMDLTNRQSYTVTSHLNAETSSYAIAAAVQMSDDQRLLFYVDSQAEADDPARWLYVRDLTQPNAAPQKLDLTNEMFKISRSGQTVLYLQNNEQDPGNYTLYHHDLDVATRITDRLNGFGFTAVGDLPFYSVEEDGVNVYIVMADDETLTLTSDEFETQMGGERAQPYLFDFDLRSSGCLSVDGKLVDSDTPYTGHGWESYFYDRLLYFTYDENDNEHITLKHYVDGVVQTIDQLPSAVPPRVGYTTDGSPLYIKNIDSDTQTGDLVLYRNGQAITLDSGVAGPVSFSTVTNYIYSIGRHIVW